MVREGRDCRERKCMTELHVGDYRPTSTPHRSGIKMKKIQDHPVVSRYFDTDTVWCLDILISIPLDPSVAHPSTHPAQPAQPARPPTHTPTHPPTHPATLPFCSRRRSRSVRSCRGARRSSRVSSPRGRWRARSAS